MALQYIEDLAGRVGASIHHWNLEELFREKDSRSFHLVKDKSQINKIFFEKYELAKADKGNEFADIEAGLKTALENISAGRAKQQIEALKQQKEKHIADAKARYAQGDDFVRRAWLHEMDIQKLGNGTLTLASQVFEVLQAGFWTFDSFDGTLLTLFTSQDIINTEINPSAGVDIRVNLGQFKARINVTTMATNIFAHKNNIKSGSFIHPHVNEVGDICWGNANETASRLRADGKIKDLLTLVATLLSTYNSSNPYRALVEFQNLAPQDRRITAPPIKSTRLGATVEAEVPVETWDDLEMDEDEED